MICVFSECEIHKQTRFHYKYANSINLTGKIIPVWYILFGNGQRGARLSCATATRILRVIFSR